MGEVYRARDGRLQRDVAIKILPTSFSADPDRLQRFAQESRAAAALNHPNILSIFDIGEDRGAPYVVSELLEGETLRDRLRNGALSSRKAIDYARQIAGGLAAAHEKGIVHRDLKPENLFITNDGRAKILDFGLAKFTRPEVDLSDEAPTMQVATEAGMVMGTAGYMSPEQVRTKPADARSDIFSFGAILYEMLSGNRAFHGDSAADTMSAILKEDPPDLSETTREYFARAGTHCSALLGEKPYRTIPIGARRCVQPGSSDRYLDFHTQRDAGFARAEFAPLVTARHCRTFIARVLGRHLSLRAARGCRIKSQLPRNHFPQRHHLGRAVCTGRPNHRLRSRLGRAAIRTFLDAFRQHRFQIHRAARRTDFLDFLEWRNGDWAPSGECRSIRAGRKLWRVFRWPEAHRARWLRILRGPTGRPIAKAWP
jgi:serine/threonine protein kinase